MTFLFLTGFLTGKSVHNKSARWCSHNFKKLHFSSFSTVFMEIGNTIFEEKWLKSVHA
jgi:hypothetical protein